MEKITSLSELSEEDAREILSNGEVTPGPCCVPDLTPIKNPTKCQEWYGKGSDQSFPIKFISLYAMIQHINKANFYRDNRDKFLYPGTINMPLGKDKKAKSITFAEEFQNTKDLVIGVLTALAGGANANLTKVDIVSFREMYDAKGEKFKVSWANSLSGYVLDMGSGQATVYHNGNKLGELKYKDGNGGGAKIKKGDEALDGELFVRDLLVIAPGFGTGKFNVYNTWSSKMQGGNAEINIRDALSKKFGEIGNYYHHLEEQYERQWLADAVMTQLCTHPVSAPQMKEYDQIVTCAVGGSKTHINAFRKEHLTPITTSVTARKVRESWTTSAYSWNVCDYWLGIKTLVAVAYDGVGHILTLGQMTPTYWAAISDYELAFKIEDGIWCNGCNPNQASMGASDFANAKLTECSFDHASNLLCLRFDGAADRYVYTQDMQNDMCEYLKESYYWYGGSLSLEDLQEIESIVTPEDWSEGSNTENQHTFSRRLMQRPIDRLMDLIGEE